MLIKAKIRFFSICYDFYPFASWVHLSEKSNLRGNHLILIACTILQSNRTYLCSLILNLLHFKFQVNEESAQNASSDRGWLI